MTKTSDGRQDPAEDEGLILLWLADGMQDYSDVARLADAIVGVGEAEGGVPYADALLLEVELWRTAATYVLDYQYRSPTSLEKVLKVAAWAIPNYWDEKGVAHCQLASNVREVQKAEWYKRSRRGTPERVPSGLRRRDGTDVFNAHLDAQTDETIFHYDRMLCLAGGDWGVIGGVACRRLERLAREGYAAYVPRASSCK